MSFDDSLCGVASHQIWPHALKSPDCQTTNYQITVPASSRRNRTDDKQKAKLLDTEAVIHYLGLDEGGKDEEEEDFS